MIQQTWELSPMTDLNVILNKFLTFAILLPAQSDVMPAKTPVLMYNVWGISKTEIGRFTCLNFCPLPTNAINQDKVMLQILS